MISSQSRKRAPPLSLFKEMIKKKILRNDGGGGEKILKKIINEVL